MNVLVYELVGNVLRPVSEFAPVSGGINVDSCHFIFKDADFRSQLNHGGALTAVFWRDKDNPYYQPVTIAADNKTGDCVVPAGVLSEDGTVRLALVLGSYNSGPLTQSGDSVFTSTIVEFQAQPSAVTETDIEQPALSLYAQFLSDTSTATNTAYTYAQQARGYAQAAESAKNSANSAAYEAGASLTAANAAKDAAQTSANNAATSANNAAVSAQAAQNSANLAQESADAAEASAQEAAESANNAAVSAQEATTSAELAYTVVNIGIKRYGARRAIGQSSPTLERVWDSIGKVAQAEWMKAPPIINDFDNIYPWSHMRECNISVIDGKIVVNAYKGDPTFKRDGSNGHVAVEIPKFYIAPRFPGDGYEYWGVSALPIGGWRLPQAFISEDGKELEKIYVATYIASEENGKFVSKSGVAPKTSITRATARALARATDSRCQLIDMAYLDVIQTLFTVEFATLNSQSVMPGAVELTYDTTIHPVTSATATTSIILSSANAAKFHSGQYIGIGTTAANPNVAAYREIIDREHNFTDGTTTIYFGGNSVNILTSHYVFTLPYISGKTDNVTASSGEYITTDTGGNITPCKYRGIENPWGNVHQYVDGVNISNYVPWVCDTPSQYADDVFGTPYRMLNYVMPNGNGVPMTMGDDERYPWARLPLTLGGTSITGYCDEYASPSSSNITLSYGGKCYDNGVGGWAAGLWKYVVSYTSSQANLFIGARIMWR